MKKLKRCWLFIVLFVLVSLFLQGPDSFPFLSGVQKAQAAAPAGQWWNSAYGLRKKITITAGAANVPSGYSVFLIPGHASLVSGGKSQADGDDIRIAYWNGSAWIELDRFRDLDTPWNDANTKIWFKTQTAITANNSDDNYYLYYNNSCAANPPANGNNVFLFYDGFESGNFSAWDGTTVSGSDTITITSSTVHTGSYAAQCTADSTHPGQAHAYKSFATQSGISSTTWINLAAGYSGVDYLSHAMHYGTLGSQIASLSIGEDANARIPYILNVPGAGYYFSDTSLSTGIWYRLEMKFFVNGASGRAELWVNGVLKNTQSNIQTGTENINNVRAGIFWRPNTAATIYFDNNTQRIWVDPEPTSSPGSEEEMGIAGRWWDNNYAIREKITVTAGSVAVPNGYSVSLTFNHASLVTGGKSQADGDDIRVVYWNGSSWQQLDRGLEPLSAWNNASTKIWFKTQTAINANTSDDNYYLYYSNPSAANPPKDWANVFTIGDDFNDGTLTTGMTTSTAGTASITETGGEAFIDLGTNEATDAGILVSTNSLPSDKKFVIRHMAKLVSGGGVSNPEAKAIGIYQLATRPTVMSSPGENNVRRITVYQRVDGLAYIFYLPAADTGVSWNGTAWVSGWLSWTTLPTNIYYIYELISDGTSWYVRVSDANGNAIPNGTTTSVPWSSVWNTGDPSWFYWGEIYTNYYYADQRSDWFYLRKYVTPEPTTSLGCTNARFENRRQITISDSMTPASPTCTADLSDFPVLISLSNQSWLRTKPNGDVYNSNGYDIIFRGSDEETQLDHEIEQYDGTNGTLVAWVRIPTLVYNGPTYIYMYYGNSAITSSTANPTGVWNTSYGWRGVWHLNEATGAQRNDSTSNANNLTQTGGVPLATGQIAGAAQFDGATQYLSRSTGEPGTTSLDITGSLTVEAWVNMAATQTDTGYILNKWRGTCGSNTNPPYYLRNNNLAPPYRETVELAHTCGPTNCTAPDCVTLSGAASMNASTFYHIAGVYDGSNLTIYRNGSVVAGPTAFTLGPYDSDGALYVGIREGTQQRFSGLIDEVRISATARDACWIGTEYNNQNNPSAFVSIDVTGTRPAPTVVKLRNFEATAYEGAVLLRWRTSYEVDNLGFHIYREEGSQLVRLTPEPVAGSALLAGSRTALTAGHHYHWWDASLGPQSSSLGAVKYWLKDIDLNGTHTMHGPVTPIISRDPLPHKVKPELLSELGMKLEERYHHYWKVQELKAKLNDRYRSRSAKGALRLRSSRTGNKVPLRTGPTGFEGIGFHKQPDPSTNELQRYLAGKSAVKLFVKEEGWYRVTQSELVAAGLSPRVNPKHLQLYMDGREQPIRVIGGNDGRFGSRDAIEFYGIGLDTPSTDTRVYWLVERFKPGKRVEVSQSQGGQISSLSFPYTVEVKDRWIYLPAIKNGEEENFFGAVVYGSGVDQLLGVKHLDIATSEDALLEVVLQGATHGPHRVMVSLNDHEAGEVVFEGQSKGLLQVEVPQGFLHEGDNLVSFIPQDKEMDMSLIDTIRLTYWHTYTVDDNGLRLTVQGGGHLSLSGFSNSKIRIFDITEPNDPIEVLGKVESQKGGYAVSFRVPGTEQRTLLALAEEKVRSPEGIDSNHPSSWHQSRDGYDLVMIGHRDFLESLQPLKKLRESQGLSVALIDVEDLYDEFSFGAKSPKAIKDFLASAKSNWRRAPRFVLLVGDASLDPRNYLGSGELDFVPTKLIDTVYMETASDDWFVDLNGDGLPEMAIGRLPLSTVEEAGTVVSKIVGYEKTRGRNEALLVADKAEKSDDFNFEGASEEIWGLLPPSVVVRKIYRRQFSSDSQANGVLLSAINQGPLLVNFIGHGSIEIWKGILTSEDAEGLINGMRLPFFVNMTCLNGYFQDPYSETLGEALLKAKEGGAIAVWTSSGLTEPDKQAVMNKELIKLLFGKESITLGEATAKAKASVSDQDIRRTWILFGDPATRLKP